MRAVWIVLVALLCSVPVFAEDDADTVHFAAHFGLSYAIEMGTYGFASKALHFDQTDAMVISAATTFTVGLLRQIVASNGGPVNTRGIWQNALGIGAALGTVYVFDF